MKTKIYLNLFFLFITSSAIFSQTVSRTIYYTGGISQNTCSCAPCVGSDYWCIRSATWGCGTPVADSRSFLDPVPPGNIITGVTVTYVGTSCNFASINTQINAFVIGAASGWGNCMCGSCNSFSSPVMSFPCGMPGYNYGNYNTLFCAPASEFCAQRVVITFNYAPSAGVLSTAPTSAAASPASLCSGPTTLTRTGGSLGTGAVWNWYTGSCGGTLVGSGSSISVTPAATATYYVRAQGTCNTTVCTPVTVTVNTPSTAPASAAASINPTCGGATALTESGGILGTGAVFNWYSGSCGGTLVGTGPSISVSPSATTTYFVSASGTCNTTACASVTVNVSAPSTAPSSASAIPDPVCAGLATALTQNGGSLGLGAVYNWYSGSCGGTLVGSGSSISVSPGSTTTYFVLASGPCNTTSCAPVTVTVNSPSAAPSSATASNNPTCGGAVTLTEIGGILGTGAVYNWYSGSCSGTLVGTGASIVVSPSSTTTYYVSASGTCNTTACASITVTVNSFSTAPSSAIASPNPVCSGLSTALTQNGGLLGSGAVYNWYSGSCGGTLVGSGSSISVTPASSTTYFVRAEGTCNTTACTAVTVTVNTPSTAPASATASINPTCGGPSVLTQICGSLGTGASYNWYSGSCNGTLVGTGASISVSPSSTTTYFVLASGTCNTTACASVTITVNTSSTAPASASASVSPTCGGATTLTEISGILGTGASYNWYSGSCNGTLVGSGSSIIVSPSSTTTYFVSASGTCNTTACVSVTVAVSSISTAPSSASAGPNPVCAGLAVTLTQIGGSLGLGAVYNWYSGSCGGTLVGSGSSISVNPTSTTTYFVRAEGTCNTTACTSVTVTVKPVPFAAASPSSQTICSGNTTSITLSSFTTGTTFAWTVVQSGVTGASPNFGSSISQILTAAGPSSGTANYTVTPTADGCVGNPIPVIVTVKPLPVVTPTPAAQVICSGGITSIALSSNVSGTSFSWIAAQSGVSGATNSSGASIAELLTALGATAGTVVYTITPTANLCAGTPVNVSITVNPLPAAAATPPSQIICSGSTTSISLTSNVSGTSFTWTAAQTGGVSGGSNGLGFLISDVLTTITPGTAVYTITPTANSCIGNNLTVVITVNPKDDASFSYSSGTYCQTGNDVSAAITGLPGGLFSSSAGLVFLNTSTGLIDLSASMLGTYSITYTTNGICPNTSSVGITITSNPTTGFSYTGSPFCQTGSNPSPNFVPGAFAGTFSSVPAGITFVNTNTGVIDLSLSSPGTYTVKNIIAASGGCAADSSTANVTIKSTPTASAAPSSQTICSGNSTSVSLNSITPGTTFSWTESQTGAVGAVPDFGPNITQVLTASGSSPGIVTYSVTPTAAGCVGNPITVLVNVNPLPTAAATPSSQAICSGAASSIVLSSNISGTSYNWTAAQTGVSGASNSNGAAITDVLTALGVTAGTVVYTVTPTANLCAGNPITVTITVNPSPLAIPTPLSQTICSGGTAAVSITSDVAGAAFTWTAAQTGVTGASNGPGAAISNVLTITGTSQGTVVYSITASANSCVGNPALATVIVNPLDDASFSYSSSTYCQSGADTFALITGLSGGLFSSAAGLVFLNTSTGLIDLSASILGTYSVTYTTNGICPNSSIIVLTVTNFPAAGFSYSGSPFCQFANNPVPVFVPNASAGIFSASPAGLAFVNVNTGEIDLSLSSPGTYSIRNIIAASGGCSADSAFTNITINSTPDAAASPSPQTICSGTITSIALTSSLPGTTYSWTASPLNVSGALSGNTALIAQTLLLTGTSAGTVVYTVTPTIGSCTGALLMDTVTVIPMDDAAFNYPSATYCISSPNQTPVIFGLPGGIFYSSPVGLSIDSVTGIITLSASTAGIYTVFYTTNGICANTSSITMTVDNNTPVSGFSYSSVSYCQSENNPSPIFAPGASAGIFSAAPSGIVFVNTNTGQIDLASSTPGTYTISNTIPASGSCLGSNSTTSFTIVNMDDASFVYSSASYCLNGANPTPAITGLPGGTFSAIPAGLSINSSTGTINLPTSTLGTYIISYTTVGACQNTSSITMTITGSNLIADFTYAGSSFCQNGTNPFPVFAAGASAGVFSSNPIGLVFININTGEIDLASSIPGFYTIINTIPAGGGCAAAIASTAITLTPNDNSSFVYSSAAYCTSGNPQIPVISGLPGGTFSSVPAGLSIDPSTGTITLSTCALGVFTISYTTNGVCPNTSSIAMTINDSAPFADFSYPAPIICQNSVNPFPAFGPGASAGIFSASPVGLVFVNVNTGEIDLASSTPGAYTVANTIPVSGACAQVIASAAIIINAVPTAAATPAFQNICSGSSISIALSSSTAATSYDWTAVPTGVSGTATGSGFGISQVLNLTGTNQGNAVYTIIPNSNGCYGASTFVTIIVNPIPAADITAVIITPASCGNASGLISGIVMTSGQTPFTYQWKDSLNNIVGTDPYLNNTAAGSYILTVVDSNGCSVTAGPFIVSAVPPVVAAFTLTPITGETPLTVNFTNNSSTTAVNYLWHFGTGDSSIVENPIYTYIPLGNFIVCLTAYDGLGCSDSACSAVDVYINAVFIVPNVFTPNGDDINDEFTIQAKGLKNMDAQIFNRWGQKEYEWHTTNGGWDGRTGSGLKAPEGTYYFIIEATGKNDEKYLEKGSFTLIRGK